MLELTDLHVSYGAVPAVRGLSLEVPQGDIVVLLGANGAGKTTTLKAIHGLVRPLRGAIRMEGKEITGRRPDQVVAAGIALCPEGRQVFPAMTVLENLEVGAVAVRDQRSVPR